MGKEQGLIACAGLVGAAMACAPAIRSTATAPPTPRQIAELWEAPADLADQNLFWGPWEQRYAPPSDAAFHFVDKDTSGFSPGYTVTDDRGLEWNVKQGPEASPEVVVSRILSAVGYHQPPVYYLAEWTLSGGPDAGGQKPGRFRPKLPGMDNRGAWSWHQNPFVGTDPYGGLLALMMLLNESDLKDDNNVLYEVDPSLVASSAHRWYVVRDLGAGLGETGRIAPRRGNPFVFAKTRFVLGEEGGFVLFDFHGRHEELVQHVTTANLHWMTNLVSRLSRRQWRDAFRAGGYGPSATEAFIETILEKIAEAKNVTQGLSFAPPQRSGAAMGSLHSVDPGSEWAKAHPSASPAPHPDRRRLEFPDHQELRVPPVPEDRYPLDGGRARTPPDM
jgi:hypothetical protein